MTFCKIFNSKNEKCDKKEFIQKVYFLFKKPNEKMRIEDIMELTVLKKEEIEKL